MESVDAKETSVQCAPGGHPRYRGEVIDTHCHVDAGTWKRTDAVQREHGVVQAIHLWDLTWPPPSFAQEGDAWGDSSCFARCHVPDLSGVGQSGVERQLGAAVRDAADRGAAGIKIWKNLGLVLSDSRSRRIAINDERLERLWMAAADTRLPVVIHIGDPRPFFEPIDEGNERIGELRKHPEWWYGAPGRPTLEQLHEEFEALVDAHRDVIFVAAHFGCFMRFADVERMLVAYPNYHLDTAAAISEMGRDKTGAVRRILVEHADRVVFGTDLIRTANEDMPDGPARWDLQEFFARHWRFFETGETGLAHPLPDQGTWTVSGVDLPDAALRALYHDNAKRLFGV
jgi:predicted TIM-barrel fold metal-dependent hydrolase